MENPIIPPTRELKPRRGEKRENQISITSHKETRSPVGRKAVVVAVPPERNPYVKWAKARLHNKLGIFGVWPVFCKTSVTCQFWFKIFYIHFPILCLDLVGPKLFILCWVPNARYHDDKWRRLTWNSLCCVMSQLQSAAAYTNCPFFSSSPCLPRTTCMAITPERLLWSTPPTSQPYLSCVHFFWKM